MRLGATAVLAAGALMCAAATATWADLSVYTQDFEGLVQTDPGALANDGWLVFGNVFDPGGGGARVAEELAVNNFRHRERPRCQSPPLPLPLRQREQFLLNDCCVSCVRCEREVATRQPPWHSRRAGDGGLLETQ